MHKAHLDGGGFPRAERIELVQQAASALGGHPQDHGWREFYRLLAFGVEQRSPALLSILDEVIATRPESGAAHMVTMFGIAVKAADPVQFTRFTDRTSPAQRLGPLERLLSEQAETVAALIAARQNSFTGTRRFLVPQVLLSAYFTDEPVRFADFGTGLGVLPAQLNSPDLYGRFAPGLRWPGGIPAYRSIPLATRFGVDRSPLPDHTWVENCHGPSDYYAGLYRELVEIMEHPEVERADVDYIALDLLDTERLQVFLRRERINAVNLSYVLYQLSAENRLRVLSALREALSPPGVVTVTEPERELSQQGCTVNFLESGRDKPWRLVHVSDGHFKGAVHPLEDFLEFTTAHPIAYSPLP
jgi:hypothetical protein